MVGACFSEFIVSASSVPVVPAIRQSVSSLYELSVFRPSVRLVPVAAVICLCLWFRCWFGAYFMEFIPV
jgi:hypothetical protein